MTAARAPLALALALALTVGLEVEARAAPDTAACIDAFDQGQRARTDRKLREAQSRLLVCTQESCPVVLRADCAGVLRTVQGAVPTIVLAADDGDGHDVTDVSVRVGDKEIAEKLDGRALEFDPGTYDFRFERKAAQPPSVVTIHDVLREGEKNRVVRASFPNPRKAAEIARASTAPGERGPVGYVVPAGLGVLGLAAVGIAVYSRLNFNSDRDDLRGSCAPTCTQDQRAALSSTLVTANVSFGVGLGLVALAGAAWLLLAPQPVVRTASIGTWAW